MSGLTVLGLRGESVKGVKAVEIRPATPTGVVKVAGKNGAGKSSTLDLILLALGGKGVQPLMPIRRGEKKATDVIELQDRSGQPVLKIARTWTEKDSYLTVEKVGQGKIGKPQDFLDAMIGAGLGFDPLAFCRLRPAQQVAMLLDLLHLAEDPRTLDVERKRLYDERTALNREMKALAARVGAMPEAGTDVPDEEISVGELTVEQERLNERLRARLVAEGETTHLAREAEAAVRDVGRLEAELDAARHRRDALLAGHAQAVVALEATPRPDFAAARQKLADAADLNARVRAKRERKAAATELLAQERQAEELTASIARLDDRKRAALAAATFPVPGLGFEAIGGEYAITFDGVPLDQAAESLKLRVGMAIAMASNPTIRVILLRDGSLLDDDTRAIVESMAKENDFQCWLELVGENEPGAFVIRDGGILLTPAAGATKTAPEVEW